MFSNEIKSVGTSFSAGYKSRFIFFCFNINTHLVQNIWSYTHISYLRIKGCKKITAVSQQRRAFL